MAAVDHPRPVEGWKVQVIKEDEEEARHTAMRIVDDAYDRAEALGEGTYGTVFKAVCKKTGDIVALKRIRMDSEKEGFPLTALREIRLLSRLSNGNIINLREVVRSKATKNNGYKPLIYMVFDYMDHDLTGLMERRNYHFPPEQLKCYMLQLFRGLHYIHSNNILHRDLKASNLLTNNQGILKIADFGLARQFDSKMREGKERKFRPHYTVRVITLWYRPLELLLGCGHYGPEIDMWSAGCILAEMLCGKSLFPGRQESDQIEKIIAVLGTPTEETLPGVTSFPHFKMIDTKKTKPNVLRQKLQQLADERHKPLLTENAVDLVEKLLCLDPDKRLTAKDACLHNYFFEQPWALEPEKMPTYEASHEMKMKQKRKALEAQGQKNAQRPRHDQQHNRQHHGAHGNRGHNNPHNQGRQGAPYRGPPGPPSGPGGNFHPSHQPRQQQPGGARGPPGPPPPLGAPMGGRGGFAPVPGSAVTSYPYQPGPAGYAPVPMQGAPFSAGGGYGAGAVEQHGAFRGSGGPPPPGPYNVPHGGPYRGPSGGASAPPQERRGGPQDQRHGPGPLQERRGGPQDQRHGPGGTRPNWDSQRR